MKSINIIGLNLVTTKTKVCLKVIAAMNAGWFHLMFYLFNFSTLTLL